MELNLGLHQRQSIKLGLTQELVQAISLLQMTSMELASFVEKIAEENPLINVDISFYKSIDSSSRGKQLNRDQIQNNWLEENQELHTPSLFEYLSEQILTMNLTKDETRFLHYLFLNLDENGYLHVPLDEASRLLNIPVETGKRALSILHTLDPSGIGARNLQECLLLQLERIPAIPTYYKQVLTDSFSDFVNKKWKSIAEGLNITMTDLQHLWDIVRKLNPRPGSSWTALQTEYIIPDVIVEKNEDNWHVKLAEDRFFQINIDQGYYDTLKKQRDPEVSTYLKQKYQQYQWLKKSMEQRKKTLIKMVNAIIVHQDDFISGRSKLCKPMTMNQIAQDVGVHESTISRIVKNKYMKTPAGTILFRSLFANPVLSGPDKSQTISSEAVKQEIQQIIMTEVISRPYSDQEIGDLLEQKGMPVSRRTIAKYREQLGIPSSTKRKRY